MALYLLSDICLLADVFQAFRNNSLDEYQLDPAYLVSAPQLAWNALLKHIDHPIPLIPDPEMYRMIQPNIRGGICHASIRYARANNKLMGRSTTRGSRLLTSWRWTPTTSTAGPCLRKCRTVISSCYAKTSAAILDCFKLRRRAHSHFRHCTI